MDFLVALVLPQTHEDKRSKIVNAVLAQLAVTGDALPIHEDVGVRRVRRQDAPTDIFRLLRVRLEGDIEASVAGEHAASAVDAGNAVLRAIGLRHPLLSVYVSVVDDLDEDDAEAGAPGE